MSHRECYVKLAATFAAIVFGTCSTAVAQTPSSQVPSVGSDESTQTKIARALSAAPRDVAREAKVAEVDSQGRIVKVLRERSNGFTCMPGDPKQVGRPAMCADKASMQWSSDFLQHKPKPTNTAPGIIYMLAGATQRSDSDPHDTTSPPIEVGPHWMIMWPFDPKATGLPTSHKPTGAYIMWAGSPYAHLHVMGSP
jgi:FlaG/FlaF family flagellin (archaellin)